MTPDVIKSRILAVLRREPRRNRETLAAAGVLDYRAGGDAIYDLVKSGLVTIGPDSVMTINGDEDRKSRYATLTARELEVVTLIAAGLTSRDIAEKLEITTKTVDSHRTHAMKKLGLRNNVELAREAILVGLAPVPT